METDGEVGAVLGAMENSSKDAFAVVLALSKLLRSIDNSLVL